MMKKAFLLFTTIILVTVLSGCIINGTPGNSEPSYYLESWDSTEGYVVEEDEEFKEFKSGTKNKPENQAKAVQYEHRYNNSSGRPIYVVTPQRWVAEEIDWEDITDPMRFSFSTKPRNLNNLIFYCDDENIYIINNKYNKYKDKKSGDKEEYRFKIRVYGVKDELDFRMVKLEKEEDW